MDELQDKPMPQGEDEMREEQPAAMPEPPDWTGPEVAPEQPVRGIPGPTQTGQTQDERTLAALAHASTLLNVVTGFLGLIVAGIIWLSYRDRSRFVAFQALQSAVFQLATLVVVAILAVITAIAWTISGVLTAVVIGLCLMPFALVLTLVVVLVPLAAIIYQLYAALQTYNGRDFEYWWVGRFMREQGWT